MVRLACLVLCLFFSAVVSAQNPFRSRQTGDWNQSSTWEEFIAGTWQLTGNTPSSASGAISIESPHIVTVTAPVTIDQATVQASAEMTINTGISVTLNQAAGPDLTIDGRLNLLGESFIDGGGEIVVNGELQAGSLNATGALVAGTTVGNLRIVNRTYNTGALVVYNGTGPQFFGSGHPGGPFTVDTEINNANGITFDNTTIGNPGGGLIIPGNLTLTSGNIAIATISGTGRTLILRGTVTPNGNTISMTGPCSLRIEGSGVFGTFPFPAGNQSIFNFTMSRPGETVTFTNQMSFTGDFSVTAGSVVFSSAASVTGNSTLTGGSVDFNGAATLTGPVSLAAGSTIFFEGQSLTMVNSFASTGGLLSSDGSSVLSLTAAIAHTTPMLFAPGSSLNTLTLSKNSGGTSATIGSAVTITTALNLTDGILDNPGGNLTLSNGATITKSSEGSITTTSPSGGPWNLIYTMSSQTTGLEIPLSGILTSLTVSTSGGTTVSLSQSINVTGAFTINGNGRIFTSGANNVSMGSFTNAGTMNAPTAAASTGLTVSGNFANNSVFNHNSGVVVIAGATIMSGTQINITNFNTISIAATGTLTAPTALNILGNMINAGAFTAGVGTVVFKGAVSTLSGATMSTTNFANVDVNAGATLVPAANFILQGSLHIDGSYTSGAGTITFNGASATSGTGMNAAQFNHVTINPASSLTQSQTTFNVGGNFTNNGTFTTGTSRSVTFFGTSIVAGTNINTTNFFDIIILGGASVTAPGTFNIQGSFTNDGALVTGAGTVAFVGNTGSRTISGGTNTQFNVLTINKTNGGTSVTISSAQTVTSALNLTAGILSNSGNLLAMSAGSTITKSNLGSITTSSPSGGPWNLIYVGSTQTTTLEVPTSGTLLSLTISVDNTRTVNLNQAVTVQNALSIPLAGRTFASGIHDVTLGSLSNSGTFVAPSSLSTNGLRISGNFANSGTFTHNNGLTTFTGTTILSGASLTTFNRLTITGTLSPSVTFAMAGNFTNFGTFNPGTSAVVFSGLALQNISGNATTFHRMRITNVFSPVGVSIETNVNLVDTLSMVANTKLDADGNANNFVFTLLSTNDSPAQDARIGELPASAQILGNVTVQRFFRPLDNFDRFISSPVSNGPVSQLQAATPTTPPNLSFPITGGFPGTSFPCTGCTNDGHNLRYYREADPGIINKGYKGWITSSASTLVRGVGYDAFMWNSVANTTVSFRGTINRGTIPLGIVTGPPANSITHTNNGVPSADGWNLVGNPYPSAIQWNNGPGWTKTNIDPVVWVWDVIGRVWHSFDASNSMGDLANGIIATGQGFWVIAPAVGAATLTVNEKAKSISGTGTFYRKNEPQTMAMKVSLSNHLATDNLFVVFNEEATDGYDIGMDAIKLQLGIEQLSVSAMDSKMRKFGHYAVGGELEGQHPIYVFGEKEGDYELRFEVINNFPGFESYYLVDTYLSKSVLIATGKPYKFTMSLAPETRDQRFYLSKTPLYGLSEGLIGLKCYPNPVSTILTVGVANQKVEFVSLLDNSGRVVAEGIADTEGNVQIDVTTKPAGLYIVRVIADGKIMIEKVLIRH